MTVLSPLDMQIKIVPTEYWLEDNGPASPKIVKQISVLYFSNEEWVKLTQSSSQFSKSISLSFNKMDLA